MAAPDELCPDYREARSEAPGRARDGAVRTCWCVHSASLVDEAQARARTRLLSCEGDVGRCELPPDAAEARAAQGADG